jgi:predicted extracellular nuclease
MTRRLRRLVGAAAVAALVPAFLTSTLPVRANSTPQTLPFSQDWSNTALITAPDNWDGVPGIIGYRGDDLTPATGTDPQTILAFQGTVNVIANQVNPNTLITGGIAEFDGIANPVAALQGSGTADCPAIILHLDTTGVQNVQVNYNLRDIDGSTDNAIQPVALQFRVGSSGNFTNVPAGFVADASTGPSLATLVTPVSATLPAAADNQPLVQVRVITCNAVGNDEWIGIDDITVVSQATGPSGTGAANPNPVVAGNSTLLTVATTQGTPPSPIVSVVADLTAIGGSASQAFSDDGTGGDVTAGDGIYSYLAFVPSDTTGGNKQLPATITDADARTGTCTISLDVLGPTPPSGVGAATPSIVPVGENTSLTVTVTPGTNPPSTGIEVVADLTSIDGPAAQPFFDDGTNGDATAGDNVFTLLYTIPLAAAPGPKTLPATITDDQGRTGGASITLTVTAAVVPVVVSQVYGAGGNSGATFRNDFIELFNPSATAADLTGWSVQYASSTGTTWEVTPLSGTLAPGHYYLVQQASGGGAGANLPVPDATGTTSMAAGSGKVLLVRSTTAQAGSCPSDPLIRDLVGYGTANCFEGAGAAPSPAGAGSSALRLLSGCTDSDNNQADFASGAVSPRNTASAPTDCGAPPPTAPLVAINVIQGSGSASPLAGQVVRARGIVTGRTSNTYFLQTPDGAADDDLNPNTSEGLIVFTSAPPTVAVGQFVETTGTVTEFIPGADLNSPPKTEITQAGVTVFSAGNPLPVPVTITAADTMPSGSIEQLEKYEAMRVQVFSLTVVAPSAGNVNEPSATSTNTGVFYGVIEGVARPFREPGIEVPDPLPPGAPQNIPRFDANPERIRVDSDLQTGAIALAVGTGDTVSSLVGPLDYSFRTYTIAPDPATPPVVTPGPAPAVPLPVPPATQFTVASYNVERFFDTVNDPGIGEPVLTAAAFNNRLNKLSLYVRNLLRTPDIIGFQEVENLTTLQAIAAKINADSLAAGDPDPAYQAYLVEGNDVGGIDVGLLVKSTRVDVIDVTQEGKNATYINPNNGQPELLNDRPSLVLRAAVHTPGGGTAPVTVIVNHLRSLSGVDDPVDGNRVRTKRRAQAEFLANLVQARQVADPAERLVVIGDLNAFGFNDGYGDSVGTIKGQPTPPDQVLLASPDLVNPDLTNLEDLAPADQRYSFLFDGNAQTLDHALVSQNVLGLVVELLRGRGNADSPDTLRNDPSRPERLADHDPFVVYFNFPTQTQTAVESSLNPSQFGQPVTFTATVTANTTPVTTGTVTFRDGASVLGTVSLNGAGQAAFTTSSLSAGPHSISARFNGAGALDVSSASLTQTVNAAATTTTAASSVNPSGFGQPVVFTATVSSAGGPVTAGTVTFREGPTDLSGPLPLNAGGQASFTISTLALGSHAITASYSGSTDFGASSGNVTQLVQPGVTVTDVFVSEGNAPGTVAAIFNVRLTAAVAQNVTVNFATQDGTALAGSDYTPRTGQVLFPSGVTSRSVAVVILSDTLNEADETFSLMLPAASNAVIVDSQGVGTILNDDPLPSLAITDVTVGENRGPAVFTIRLSAASGRDVTVDYTTADGTATAPIDYAASAGPLTFPAGTTTRTVSVQISADGLPEPVEDFFVVLFNVANASLADGLGVGRIVSGGGPALQVKAPSR